MLKRIIAFLSVILGIIAYIYYFQGADIYLFVASILGFYMAINIGANDVANNMGPPVGSKAITIGKAILIAAVFEFLGAMIAGGDVINTIKGGIIDTSSVEDPRIFIYIMIATLLGSALWINLATLVKAPVSATHSIIGGLMGAGVSVLGFGVVQWGVVGKIAASWVISPLLGGLIAAGLVLAIRQTIFQQKDRVEAAKTWVPVYISLMSFAFGVYLVMKGLKKVVSLGGLEVALIGLVIAGVTYFLVKHHVNHMKKIRNKKSSINKMFAVPLVMSAALLSFAHGANDVANAIGPLAAIADTVRSSGISTEAVGIPKWVMLIGALGIAFGLGTFGARLIKTVGNEITKLNETRAFCVALAAAITVIIASHLGLPVSSTHIAIGGIFGVGLLREYIKHIHGKDKEIIHKKLLKNILLAWIVTLPSAALLSGGICFTLVKFF